MVLLCFVAASPGQFGSIALLAVRRLLVHQYRVFLHLFRSSLMYNAVYSFQHASLCFFIEFIPKCFNVIVNEIIALVSLWGCSLLVCRNPGGF